MPSNNLTITAIFYEKQQYTITITKNEGGSITGSINLTTLINRKSSSFYVDDIITLNATPSTDYQFDGWYVGGQLFKTDKTISFYMLEMDFSIEARFSKTTSTTTYYKIEVLPTGANGSVSCSVTQAKAGTQITMTATPYLNLTQFEGWYYNGRLLSTNKTYTFTMPANNVTIYAKFK